MNWDMSPYTMLAIAMVLEEVKSTWYSTLNLWFWFFFIIILDWLNPTYRKWADR